MSFVRFIDRNWDSLIRWVPAKIAHDLSGLFLKFYCSGLSQLKANDPKTAALATLDKNIFRWKDLTFRNRLGLAGGADKNAKLLSAWNQLGFGFVEIGTVTPYAQKPNPGQILSRDIQRQSLWNKMGFPNDGSEEVSYNLMHTRSEFSGPVFVNIGKNRWTKDDEAHLDYAFVAARFSEIADAFVINVSSPNTKGLRGLQNKQALQNILATCKKRVNDKKPFLIKLSPDIENDEFKSLIKDLTEIAIDGIILTNTTTTRLPGSIFPTDSGGASGLSVAHLAKEKLKIANDVLQSLGLSIGHPQRPLLVSVGGVIDQKDYIERITLGADLVQCYSALVLKGPSIVRRILST